MAGADYRRQQRIYTEGIESGRYSTNPYVGRNRIDALLWERGHRDRWLHGMHPKPRVSRSALLLTGMIAFGAIATLCSLGNAVLTAIQITTH